MLATIWRFAWITGLAGFMAGYVGPIIFTPQSNQGPLLGIFITGPGGLLLGAAAGLVWSLWNRR